MGLEGDELEARIERVEKDEELVKENYDRLLENGKWFWTEEMMPDDLYSEDTKKILETKDEFLEILEKSSKENIVSNLLNSENLDSRLAIRHAMLATNTGKEGLDRLASYFSFFDVQQAEASELDLSHEFNVLGQKDHALNNSNLNDIGDGILEDIAFILCFGEYMESLKDYPTFDRCKLGGICGDENEIADYFADLYVLFSNQTQGRIRVKKGNLAENITEDFLNEIVKDNPSLEFADGNRVPDVPKEGDNQQFDFVLKLTSDGEEKYIAIPVAFQETTNSVIERKARQARELYPRFKELDFYLCHVVDGAGYYKRSNALKQMIQHSDLSIGFNELEKLEEFISKLSDQSTLENYS